MTKPNGYVIWEGPSAINGEPVVAIATGIRGSSNRKTGAMVQTYILRRDISPVDAVKSGADAAICGDCPHRGDDGFAGRTCYVNVGQGPLSVWSAYQRGSYPRATTHTARVALGAGRKVRLGTYGDPMAAPAAIWESLIADAELHTGYTHQWHPAGGTYAKRWAKLVMASVDTVAERDGAQAAGWRTFRVSISDNPGSAGEVLCPASEEAGKKLTCETCGACNGNATGRRGSIVIPLHGSNAGAKGQAALTGRLIATAAVL